MMELVPGQVLGEQFLLVRRVAETPGGQVWLAEDRAGERRVALKLLDARLLSQPGAIQRLHAEVEQSRRLPRDRAVIIESLQQFDGVVALVMEYFPGGDLAQFRGRPYNAFLPQLLGVAESLARLHADGLVHRDVKCSNVLLDGIGQPRLADFGLTTLAGLRAVGGSPYNASPQQLRGEPASASGDCYAFGAMLYELLSGYPPFYPDVTRDRVLSEPAPPLIARHPAPERLRRLALRLLAKSPAERPASMAEVRDELEAASRDPVAEDTAILTGRDLPGGPAPAVGTESAPRRWLGWAVGGVLVAAAIGVFVWLPGFVAERSASVAADAAAQTRTEIERARRQSVTAEAEAAARAEAEAGREPVRTRIAGLAERAAAVWGAADLARVRELAGDAQTQYDLANFADAAALWQQAGAVLDALDAARPAALARALADGAAAIEQGQARAATDAYSLALRIEPGDAAAQAGLARAATLDEVLAELDAAAASEQAGRLTEAEQAYRRALALDANTAGAAAGLARISATRSADAFAATMSRGFAAMAEGRTAAARAALEQGAALRPDAAGPRDALAELERSQRAAGLAALEQRALSAERAERWVEAKAAWEEALKVEPTLAAAQAGVARVTPRVRLEEGIDALIGASERLWDTAERRRARELIASARAAADPRERLLGQASRLDQLVAAAETPVELVLESDGITEVVINRVGRIGSFARQRVELLPGRYAVVGSRVGYRDVRREVVILPGQQPAPVTVRAEEPI